MEYNFDILLAGCNTNCRHCYVDGGPANRMPTDLFDLCLDKLLPVFSHFGDRATFTLDNELYLHPDLLHIFSRIKQDCWSHYYHHGSTTGIAFNHRQDREAVWNFQEENDIAFAGVTLHGAKEHHNFITRNPQSFDEAMRYISFVKKHGGKLYISLMLSSFLIEDRDEITAILQTVAPDGVYFAVTLFAPSHRMLDYQKYRATYDDAMKLKGYLSQWNLCESELLDIFQKNHSYALIQELKQHSDFDFISQPETVYFTIHQNLDLFVGNTGAEIEKVGNMRSLSSDEIIARMKRCRPNYAFFPSFFPSVPSYEHLLDYCIKHSEIDYIYPNLDSFLTYHFFSMMQNPPDNPF